MNHIYLIGSLRERAVPDTAHFLREQGLEVFDDWYAAGPRADDHWQAYETERGRTLGEALKGKAARNVVQFDRLNLDLAAAAVLVMPAGKSGHLELGYCIGKGTPAFVLFDKGPERWDVMYGLAAGVFTDTTKLASALRTITELT